MLERIVKERWFRPNAVVGFWPANAVGDDIALYADEGREERLATLFTLRQQLVKRDGRPNLALADFVAPRETRACRLRRRLRRHGGRRGDAHRRAFRARQRRLFARSWSRRSPTASPKPSPERMHSACATSSGATRPTRRLTNEELISEAYRGIRPAPGYPAQPDHTEKATLFRLLDARARDRRQAHRELRHVAGARRSRGLYLSHPDAHYFGVAKVERDQVEDYARRKGWSIGEVERWLAPILELRALRLRGTGCGRIARLR